MRLTGLYVQGRALISQPRPPQGVAGTYSVQGSLAAALPVGPRAPSEAPEVLGPALRLEGPAVGVHAIGQQRGQLSSPGGGVALASAPPTSAPHASGGGGGVLPAVEAAAPGSSAPARGPLPRPPAGAREGGVSIRPHFGRSEAIKAGPAPSSSAHDPKAHASALGHHVAPGVAVTEATGSVEISGAEGGGARVERLVLVKPAEGGRRRAKVKRGPWAAFSSRVR